MRINWTWAPIVLQEAGIRIFQSRSVVEPLRKIGAKGPSSFHHEMSCFFWLSRTLTSVAEEGFCLWSLTYTVPDWLDIRDKPSVSVISQMSVQITAVNRVWWACCCPRRTRFLRVDWMHCMYRSRSDAFLEALAIVSQAVNYVHACAAIPGFPQSCRFSMHTYSSCVAHLQDMHAVMADGVETDPNWDWWNLSGTTNWARGLLLVYPCARRQHELCQESPGGNCHPGFMGQRLRTAPCTHPRQIWLLSCRRSVHFHSCKWKLNHSLLWGVANTKAIF